MYKMVFFGSRGSSFFQKASPVFSNVFQQGKQLVASAPALLERISPALGNVGRILDKAGEIGGKIATNSALTSIQSPNLQKGLSLIGKASGYATKASGVAHSADKFVRPDTYTGSSNEVNLTNALERAKGLRREGANIFA